MHNYILRNLFAQVLNDFFLFCYFWYSKGNKTLLKWSTSIMQKMNQFLTAVPVSLMEIPWMHGLLFLAASVS